MSVFMYIRSAAKSDCVNKYRNVSQHNTNDADIYIYCLTGSAEAKPKLFRETVLNRVNTPTIGYKGRSLRESYMAVQFHIYTICRRKMSPKHLNQCCRLKLDERSIEWRSPTLLLLNKAQIEYMYIIVYTQFLTVASYTYMYIYKYIYIYIANGLRNMNCLH